MELNIEEIQELAIEWLYTPVKLRDDTYIPGMVQHPFFDFVFACDEKGLFNMLEEPERLETVRKARKHLINRQKTIYGILSLICKPYRIYFLQELYELGIADKKTCGNALGEIWSALENNDSTDEETQNLMLTWLLNADKNIIMCKEDLREYNNLPEQIVIYRGVQPNESIKGFSWSLSKNIAEWFAQRHEPKGNVYSLTVDKKHIIAYIDDRDEKEIIVDYTKINEPVLV